jgi:hypothetical protein
MLNGWLVTGGAARARRQWYPDHVVERALGDDVLGQRLADELLDRNLGQPSVRTVGWGWRR